VGGELPPVAPRHGGCPLQQKRRRREEEVRMEACPGSAARELHCGAARDPEPAAEVEGKP